MRQHFMRQHFMRQWFGCRRAPVPLRELQRVAVFSAFDAPHGFELWKTNGTAAGTKLVMDAYPGGRSDIAFVSPMAVLGNRRYLLGDDGQTGTELWSTDTNGTSRRKPRTEVSGSAPAPALHSARRSHGRPSREVLR